jgi:hypothetical protein
MKFGQQLAENEFSGTVRVACHFASQEFWHQIEAYGQTGLREDGPAALIPKTMSAIAGYDN